MLNRVMAEQPQVFVQTNAKQIKVVLDPVLKSHSNLLHTELCDLLTKLVDVYPPSCATAPPAVAQGTAEVYDELHSILHTHLSAAVAAPATSPVPGQPLPAAGAAGIGTIAGASTAGALRVLNVLLATSPKHVDRHLPNVVKLLVRQVRLACWPPALQR
jgi:hypothetical protein